MAIFRRLLCGGTLSWTGGVRGSTGKRKNLPSTIPLNFSTLSIIPLVLTCVQVRTMTFRVTIDCNFNNIIV